MDMAMLNIAQLHIANKLENAYNFNERPRFHERDDAFELPKHEFVKLFRLRKERAEEIIDIVAENSVEPSRSSALDATIQKLAFVVYLLLDEMQQEEKAIRARVYNIERRILRDTEDPFTLPEVEFIKLFRLTKDLTRFIIETIRPELERQRRHGLSVYIQMLITLQFLGYGSYQRAVGQGLFLAVSQLSVSKTIRNVTRVKFLF